MVFEIQHGIATWQVECISKVFFGPTAVLIGGQGPAVLAHSISQSNVALSLRNWQASNLCMVMICTNRLGSKNETEPISWMPWLSLQGFVPTKKGPDNPTYESLRIFFDHTKVSSAQELLFFSHWGRVRCSCAAISFGMENSEKFTPYTSVQQTYWTRLITFNYVRLPEFAPISRSPGQPPP